MRVAILSDIHGNTIALDAVLADIESVGDVDTYWILGDLAALGHDPVGALERLSNLPNAQVTRGNTDRYLVSGELPFPTIEQAQENPSLLRRFYQVGQNFAWTQGALSTSKWFDWLAALPLEQTMTLPDGTRVLGVHAAPSLDDGEGIHPLLNQTQLHALVDEAKADLIFVGHTHWAMDVEVSGARIVNLGSVSNPLAPDLRAKYILLEADANGYRLLPRRIEYDRRAVIAALEQTHNPARDYMIRYMQGQNIPSWHTILTPAEANRLELPEIENKDSA